MVSPRPGGYNLVGVFPQTTESWAVFGQVDYELTDKFKLTVGARWTDDKKDYQFQQGWYNVDGLYVFFEGVNQPGDVPYFDFKDEYSSGDWSGKAQLDYKQDRTTCCGTSASTVESRAVGSMHLWTLRGCLASTSSASSFRSTRTTTP